MGHSFSDASHNLTRSILDNDLGMKAWLASRLSRLRWRRGVFVLVWALYMSIYKKSTPLVSPIPFLHFQYYQSSSRKVLTPNQLTLVLQSNWKPRTVNNRNYVLEHIAKNLLICTSLWFSWLLLLLLLLDSFLIDL